MLLTFSQILKQFRLFYRSFIKMISCPEKLTSVLLTGWHASAYCILPLLLAFYNFQGVVLFFAVVVSLCGVLFFLQDSLLYYNNTPENSRLYVQMPSELINYEIVQIVTDDLVVLQGFLLKVPSSVSPDISSCYTIVYFHGNAGNIGHRLPNAMEMVVKLECNVLLVEYRGYGKSTGRISEKGLYLDARAAIKFVKANQQLNPEKVILFGRSLGGAVVVDTAASLSEESVQMMIVENSFTHIADVADIMFPVPGLSYVPRFLYKNKFGSIEKIHNVTMPSLFISGQADQIVPPHMMVSLFQKCSATKKRLLKVKGGTHNDTWNSTGYYESVKKFMDEALGKTPMGRSSSFTGNNQADLHAVETPNSPTFAGGATQNNSSLNPHNV